MLRSTIWLRNWRILTPCFMRWRAPFVVTSWSGLAGAEMSVSELRSGHDISLAAASKHVRVLQDAGMVARRLRGRDHLCRIRPDVLRSASAWLLQYEAHWSASLDRLAAVLEEPEA